MPSLTDNAVRRQNMAHSLKGTWADRVILLAALAAIAAAWFVVQARIASGPAMAEVYHNDTLLAAYPLPQTGGEPISLQVEGHLGTTEIIIDAQGARIASSPCSTQRCVLSGYHRHAGDMIACVPNRILVTLRGGEHSGFDAIVE